MDYRWFCTILIISTSLICYVSAGLDVKNIKVKRDKEETKDDDPDNKPHSRQKRLIWVTDDGRLALPPGTSLTITPTLALPFVRYPPDGFFSNISISLPLTSKFFNLDSIYLFIMLNAF